MPNWDYWEILPVHEFVKLTLPNPKWLVETLIPGDGWTYVIGYPKHGKSILMAQVGDAIVKGQPVLDCPAPHPGPVVYVQSDAPPAVWQAQLQVILDQSPMLTVRTPKGMLMIPGALEKARALLETHKAKLVIWDALEHITGTLRINEEDGAKEVLKRLKLATPCPFVMIHHPRKAHEMEDASVAAAGHHFLAGDASAILRVTKTGAHTGTLDVVGRLMESRVVKLTRGPGGRWRWTPPAKGPVSADEVFAQRVPQS